LNKRIILCLPLFGAVTALAQSPSPPPSASPVPSLTAACGDEKAAFSVDRGPIGDKAAGPADKARVYIVEIYNLRDKGRFNRPTVRQGLDGAWLGATQGFSYLSADVAPGPHHLCSRWQSHFGAFSNQVSLNNFEAEAGKQYYFRASIVIPGGADGTGEPSIDLQPVSEDEGRFLISEAAQSVSKLK
jgi:hypothetical protein